MTAIRVPREKETPHVASDEVKVKIEPDYDVHLMQTTEVLRNIMSDADYENPRKGYYCLKCGKGYKTLRTLHSHTMFKHEENTDEIKCMKCDKKYSSALSLKKHMEYMHLSQYKCKVCYKTFATAKLMVNHSEHCHTNASPCLICSKVFDSRLSLQNHVKYKHPKSKEHWCGLCRRSFTCERSLTNHENTAHAGGTVCDLCDQTFISVSALQSHILYKHSKDRKRCFYCHKVFAKKISLKRHIIRMHQRLNSNLHEHYCSVCLKQFASIDEVVHHLMNSNSCDKKEDTE